LTRKTLAVGIIVMLVVSVNLSSIAMNTEKTTNDIYNDYSALLHQVKTNIGSSRGWVEEQQLLASDGESNDHFGLSVSIDGDNAIIGAYADEPGGSAYIFKYNGTCWIEEQKLIASDGEEDENFGKSVSIDGDNILIGADKDHNEIGNFSGSAYMFKYNGTSWNEQQKLTASDGENYDFFGSSVSIDGDFAIIGADMKNDQTGSVYVFKYNGTSWNEQQKLLASDAEEHSSFGKSISIDGENVLIGSPKRDDIYIDSGAAYLFKYNGTSWNEQQIVIASDGEEVDNFGYSVSIDGNNTIIGAYGDNDNGENSGSAYVFKYDGVSWNEQQKLKASDGDEYDSFGKSVSIDGNTVIIGAYAFDIYKGASYVFKYNGVSWSGEQKLIPSNGFAKDHFGWSVSINNDKAVVGAPFYYGVMGSAYIFIFENLTIPDLNCNGHINLEEITPGETVVEIIRVQNIGGPDTLLNYNHFLIGVIGLLHQVVEQVLIQKMVILKLKYQLLHQMN